MLKKKDLGKLSLEQLHEMRESLEVFLMSQKPLGEPYHPEYRKDKELFKKLLSKTVRFRSTLNRFFKGQWSRAGNLVNLYKVSAAQIELDMLNNDYWDREDLLLAADIEVDIGNMFDVGSIMALAEFGNPITVDHSQLSVMKALGKYTLKLAKDINDTTKERIANQIRQSIDKGEVRDQMADRINKVINNPKRSTTIAQTESIRTFANAKLEVGRRLGIKRKMWMTTVSPCPICSELNRREIDMDATFEGNLDGPPAHPNCKCILKLVYDPNEGIDWSKTGNFDDSGK